MDRDYLFYLSDYLSYLNPTMTLRMRLLFFIIDYGCESLREHDSIKVTSTGGEIQEPNPCSNPVL